MELTIRAAAREAPDRPALVQEGRVVSYRALGELADRATEDLARRAPDPTVPLPLRTPLHPQTVAALWALVQRGQPFAPLHPRWTEAEVQAAAAQLDGEAVLRQRPLAVFFTSGSGGRPKGVMLGPAALVASARASARRLRWRADDRWLLSMPLAHVGGFCIALRCLLARSCVVLPGGQAQEGRFDPEAIVETVTRQRVTLLSLVPTMLQRLLDLRPSWCPPTHVRAMVLGGAPPLPGQLLAARDRGWPVLTTYGMTETASQVTLQRPGDPPDPSLGAGPPLEGVRLRIRADRILVRGPTLLSGYADGATGLGDDGWFDTGDLGRLDEAGHLHVLGRADQRIISGGENVNPAEVERVLTEHSGVKTACVVGVPDRDWGEAVGALIVLDDGGATDLESYLRQSLATFKHPRIVRFASALPTLPNGKVDRGAVRSMLGSWAWGRGAGSGR